MTNNRVLVIGGGVTGLAAALELARFNIDVEIVDRSDFMGGHGIQYTCKATDKCVRCGACMVEDKLSQAVAHPNITLSSASHIRELSKNRHFEAIIDQKPVYIDPQKCTDCGVCFQKCPVKGAITSGYSSHQRPFFALDDDKCAYIKDGSCTVCKDACPEAAIDLDQKPQTIKSELDAIIVATGFTPYDPADKPYGYKRFPNVVTSLDLERMLRRSGRVERPSDGVEPSNIAFIQCVGSRDAKLGHIWCSKVCCGSALRMARVIKAKKVDMAITFFYIDVQTFGKDFNAVYPILKDEIQMVRSIPGDIYPADNDRLKVIFADSPSHKSMDETFDLVVLSIGMTPGSGGQRSADNGGVKGLDPWLAAPGVETGFIQPAENADSIDGVFTAGTVKGPMSIAQSIADAGSAAWKTLKYIGIDLQEEK